MVVEGIRHDNPISRFNGDSGSTVTYYIMRRSVWLVALSRYDLQKPFGPLVKDVESFSDNPLCAF